MSRATRLTLLVGVLLAVVAGVGVVLLVEYSSDAHRHGVTYERFEDGISCYVWNGDPISCTGGTTP